MNSKYPYWSFTRLNCCWRSLPHKNSSEKTSAESKQSTPSEKSKKRPTVKSCFTGDDPSKKPSEQGGTLMICAYRR